MMTWIRVMVRVRVRVSVSARVGIRCARLCLNDALIGMDNPEMRLMVYPW